MEHAQIGIIGGSGFYDMPGLEEAHAVRLKTPFGAPSEKILLGKLNGRTLAFLSRHGLGHRFSPSEVNYRANLFALKMLGVETLVSVTAVGSLKEELRPRDMVIPDQYVDASYRREKTFFGDGLVAHVSLAEPTCTAVTALAFAAAGELGMAVHRGGVYYNMEGPQFSSRGESLTYRRLGYDLIGMTQAVEAKLARELEMCFLPLAFVTDYDCWHEQAAAVTVDMVVENLNHNTENARRLIRRLCEVLPATRSCGCPHALASAMLTNPALIPEKTFSRLQLVIGKYVHDRM